LSKRVAIIGAGGFAREVLDIFDASNESGEDNEVLGYIVESQYGLQGEIISDKPILGNLDWFQKNRVHGICAVGAPDTRLRLVSKAKALGVEFCNIIHPSAILTRWIDMGEGVVIGAGCILTNNIKIGSHVHINLSCTIGHDAVIEDFVTLSPGVHVSGKVKICCGSYVGTGANIIDRVNIGEWAIVGAGSTIIEDVPPNTVVVGVPGRVIKVREAGWHLKREVM
jgi:sugar O-acyltransferase (sialic acid O-acetyltransferase NeuD family)